MKKSMGKTGEFGLFVKQEMKDSGSKTKMLTAARKIKKGHVAVWQLTPEGARVGRRPVYRTFDGVEK
jgi:hypothetical protein